MEVTHVPISPIHGDHRADDRFQDRIFHGVHSFRRLQTAFLNVLQSGAYAVSPKGDVNPEWARIQALLDSTSPTINTTPARAAQPAYGPDNYYVGANARAIEQGISLLQAHRQMGAEWETNNPKPAETTGPNPEYTALQQQLAGLNPTLQGAPLPGTPAGPPAWAEAFNNAMVGTALGALPVGQADIAHYMNPFTQEVIDPVVKPIPLDITATDADSITLPIPDAATLSTETISPPDVISPPLDLINYDIFYPADSGVINVKTDHGAKGDGVTDDTQAIISALEAAGSHPRPVKPVFLPAGTYLVSDTVLRKDSNGLFVGDMILYGQGEGKTTIKLMDNAPGFGNPTNPKPVVLTASYCFAGEAPSCNRNRDHAGKGEGNEAYRNFVRDLTVDTGSGNPGAIGIDFLANNGGSVRRVTVRSGDGQGVAGVSMTRKWPGPAIIKNVHVQGFDYGVDVSQSTYGMVLENLTVEGQNKAGIRNNKHVLSVRNMRSVNSVPAIQNLGTFSLLSVLDSHFEGGVSASSAIENEGHLFARNVTTAGYNSAIQGVSGEAVSEYNSHPVLTLFSSSERSLNLPIKETPTEPFEPSDQWTNVEDFGAIPRDVTFDGSNIDNTPLIQAAIDSGATTLYFPPGQYSVKGTIYVRGNVRHLIGLNAQLVAIPGHIWTDVNNKKPLWSIEDGTSDTVWLHDMRFNANWYTSNKAVGVISMEVNTNRTFVMLDTRARDVRLLGQGDVFIENICCPTIEHNAGNLWVRMYDVERTSSSPSLKNNGGNVWVLGVKTERAQTVVEGNNGSKTEIFGGMFYPVRDVPITLPAIVNNESRLSVSFAGIAYAAGKNYDILVEETRDGVTKTLKYADVPSRPGYSSMLPLYVGAPKEWLSAG